ncbi:MULTISPECIES: alkyl hydroperoxide reductase [Rhodanobacter]|uniref:alkyl hydroperoxide reductase n=1 Tax=Rhodanobacter TaxID=75309 RepID=UPI0004287B95|nr:MULTISPECIES: alkyl hydroperoxide reductase [Rhodanobacter]KZC18524.1 alkyl hydroperoxide reductase [Rhodanobacter denitrificans]UJJ49795.1 TlpA family protein disulfide reductase [Rhodanobacter denitrificans]UJM92508.1 TlpA family protein disulfide reductase [Rhodanobacter denitrificans]UJM96038.1 TlpA family protein disulfide reductase [Rhodanobacter denitrificans]UJN21131.1 TlpA family protein disulfide reductase [Rhodanobacter denitrificans]
MKPEAAPEWRTSAWLNTPEPLSVAHFRGRVVLLHAFQMLCPGCVAHGIPQAQRVATLFEGAPLAVVGLHTVFEHHAAMGPESLRAFLHEYRVGFPVGIDAPGPDGDPIPRTMRAYAMQGTPTAILIDAQGRLRNQVFGQYDDLLLGAEIGALLVEAGQQRLEATGVASAAGHCADGRREADAEAPGQNPLS